MAEVTAEKSVLHIVSGGHTDGITGKDCHWNVYPRLQHDAIEANAVSGSLIKNYGKKWYFITPDYAFGHTLQAGEAVGSSAAPRSAAISRRSAPPTSPRT